MQRGAELKEQKEKQEEQEEEQNFTRPSGNAAESLVTRKEAHRTTRASSGATTTHRRPSLRAVTSREGEHSPRVAWKGVSGRWAASEAAGGVTAAKRTAVLGRPRRRVDLRALRSGVPGPPRERAGVPEGAGTGGTLSPEGSHEVDSSSSSLAFSFFN